MTDIWEVPQPVPESVVRTQHGKNEVVPMRSDIRFRHAIESDYAAIIVCLHPFGLPCNFAIRSGQYVAVVDGNVCGTARLEIVNRLVKGREARIEDVAVLPSHGRKGIGSALVAYIVEEAKKAGCYKVQLTCHPKLERWYSKMGFRRYEVNMRMDLAK